MNERLRKMTCQLQCAPVALILAVLLFVVMDVAVSWAHQHAAGLTQTVRMAFASILVLAAAGLVAGVTTAVSRKPVTRHYHAEDEYDMTPFRRAAEEAQPAMAEPVPAPAPHPAVILNLRLKPEPAATPAPVPEPAPERLPTRVTEVPR